MNSWSITASLLIESRDRVSIGQRGLTVSVYRLNVPASPGDQSFFLEVVSTRATVPPFLSLDTSCSAIFFTFSIGTCSKCVWDFRVESFDLAIDEQYPGARRTGHLFWKPSRVFWPWLRCSISGPCTRRTRNASRWRASDA